MAEETAHLTPAAILGRRRREAERDAALRKEEIYKHLPRLSRCDEEAAAVCRRMTGAAMEGNTEALVGERAALDRLVEEKREILREAGLSESDLSPRYTCPLCRDTGYVEGRRCRCLTALLQEEAARQLPAGVLSSVRGFDGFDLSFYSETETLNGVPHREVMKTVLGRCRDYALRFGPKSGNLLFSGRTGLGKTYLSISIAREVLERGFSVYYVPAQTMIDHFERVRFSRSSTPGDADATREILRSDLLILDDLGAEFVNSFSQSVLYSVLNERLVAGRPTIISTNLDFKRLAETYSERIVSRLIGNYTAMAFVGRDIRQQKLLREREARR